jgi:hypothetical protein
MFSYHLLFFLCKIGISTHHINKTTHATSSTPDPLLSSLSRSTLTFKSQPSCFPQVLHLTMQIGFQIGYVLCSFLYRFHTASFSNKYDFFAISSIMILIIGVLQWTHDYTRYATLRFCWHNSKRRLLDFLQGLNNVNSASNFQEFRWR